MMRAGRRDSAGEVQFGDARRGERVGEELHDECDGGVETAVRDANEDVAGLEAGRRDCGEGQGFEEGAAAG